MGFRVNTNVSSLAAQRTLGKANKEVEESSTKLSSGERITKAADDAAGLAISEKLKAEVRSSKQAHRNASDGIGLIQTAEGGLNEASSLLTRMRELAVQAASDTLGASERSKSNLEYQALKQELERISLSTEFNGKKLLNGTGAEMTFQVGTGDNSSDDHISFRPSAVNAGIQSLGLSGVTITTKGSAQESLGKIDEAINKISGHRSLLGSIQNRLISSSSNLSMYVENMSAANSRIRDTDYAIESANHARGTIVSSAGTAVLAQANVSGQNALKLV